MSIAKYNPMEILAGATIGIPAALLVYLRMKYPNMMKDIQTIQTERRKSKVWAGMELRRILLYNYYISYTTHHGPHPHLLEEWRPVTIGYITGFPILGYVIASFKSVSPNF